MDNKNKNKSDMYKNEKNADVTDTCNKSIQSNAAQRESVSLTTAEWNLMECLWSKSPRKGREVVDYLSENVGWTRSTTLTMLRRMTDKKLISCDESGDVLTYTPLVNRETAVLHETDSFIKRVYKGSVSMMMNAITKKQNLSQEEIDELYAILKQAEKRSDK